MLKGNNLIDVDSSYWTRKYQITQCCPNDYNIKYCNQKGLVKVEPVGQANEVSQAHFGHKLGHYKLGYYKRHTNLILVYLIIPYITMNQ